MAKGQQRSNREIKKPKKKKAPVAAPGESTRGPVASIGTPGKPR